MIKLHNVDCMKYLAKCEDNAFNLAIVDPPYGIGWDKENTSMSAGIRANGTIRPHSTWKNPRPKNYKRGNWDNAIPSKEYFNELERVSVHAVIFGGNYFTKHLRPSGGWIVWDKGVPEGMSLSQAELAWTNKLNSVKVTKHLWAGYKKCESVNRVHPTQKPVKLYEWLLMNYAKEGDRILDTHLGSGSIAIACHNLGFDLVGCELDEDYYNAACKRLKQHQAQQRMF
jgi:site-specific DNA-methyltransferase (adenine-specific)